MLCAWVIIFTVLGEINYIEAFIFDLWHQYTPWTDSKILSALAWLLNYSGEQTSLEMKNAFGALTFYISIRKEPSANGKCWSKSSYFNLPGCPFCRRKEQNLSSCLVALRILTSNFACSSEIWWLEAELESTEHGKSEFPQRNCKIKVLDIKIGQRHLVVLLSAHGLLFIGVPRGSVRICKIFPLLLFPENAPRLHLSERWGIVPKLVFYVLLTQLFKYSEASTSRFGLFSHFSHCLHRTIFPFLKSSPSFLVQYMGMHSQLGSDTGVKGHILGTTLQSSVCHLAEGAAGTGLQQNQPGYRDIIPITCGFYLPLLFSARWSTRFSCLCSWGKDGGVPRSPQAAGDITVHSSEAPLEWWKLIPSSSFLCCACFQYYFIVLSVFLTTFGETLFLVLMRTKTQITLKLMNTAGQRPSCSL